MNTKEAQQLIKNTFEQDFNKNRFELFIRNLLKDNYEKASFSYTGNYIPVAYREFINKLERLGKYEDYEGNLFDVLVVELQQKHSVHAARVTQRNFIRWYLNGSRGNVLKDGALVAFHNPEAKEWRFSFVKMQYSLEKQKDEFTPAKRYSYLVGENEHSHTAQKQLVELLRNDEIPSLEELENSFSIEKVTQRFFDQYKELFLVLKETIDNALQKDPKAMQEFTSKNIDAAAFAKKTLGQIVFLYFLQKKGWLGVKEHENWGTGNRRFLNNLHEQCINEDKNFFNDYLKYLFYDALANERPETDEHQKDYYERFGSKIPFLNGGLFEPMNEYDWKNINLLIPDTVFSNNKLIAHDEKGNGILDIFNRYNFTVKEDEPLDTEVAVDPEMLGKVFENLLEITDRRSKGAFYTPREIVHYMCQESLINYLYTQLSENLELSESFRTDIETFIKNGTTILEHDKHVELAEKETKTYSYKLPESIRKNAKAIDTALANVKICDPAIGSGAFPVGLLHEIITARQVLDIYLKNNISTYELKRHAIYESIYGVDIDPSAVDIAKLRLWLSLVVDEDNYEDIKPLPNLDYKIACGNSLIGLPQDIIRNHELEKQIEVLKEEFFNTTDQQEKHDLKIEINNKIKELIKSAEQFISYKIDFDFRLYFSEVFNKNPKNSPEVEMVNSQIRALNAQVDAINKGLRLQGEDEIVKLKIVSANQQIGIIELEILKIEKIISKIYGEITKVENNVASEPKNYSYQISALNKNIKQLNQKIAELNKQLKKNTPDEGGFDIVIGNPPYVEHKKLKNISPLLKQMFSVYTGSSDLSVYFFEKGFNILKNNGHLTFINTNKFFNTGYGKSLRKFLLTKSIKKLINFEQVPIFEKVLVSSVIFQAQNRKEKDNQFYYSLFYKEANWRNEFEKQIKERAKVFNQSDFDEREWNFITGITLKIKKLIENKGKMIKNYKSIKIKRGVTTGCDPAFIINEKKKSELNAEIIKPLLKGREIKKNQILFSEKYLIFTRRGINISKYPTIEQYLNKYYEDLKPRTGTETKGRKPGNYKWFEIQDNTAYYPLFEEEKIIWPLTADKWGFTIDTEKHYLTSGGFFMVSDDLSLKYILAVLNSNLMQYYFSFIGVMTAGGAYTLKKATIEELPLIKLSKIEQKPFETLVNYILFLKKQTVTTSSDKLMPEYFEQIVDAMVFELYFEEEVKAKGVDVLKHLQNLPDIENLESDAEKLETIKKVFKELNNENHPVRYALLMQKTVPEIRTIKEAVK